MKRFIIKLFASSYHYWVWKQKREDAYYNTFLFIAFMFTLMEMNLDILTGGHLLYITLKIGGVTPFIVMLASIVINYFLLKWIFPAH